MQQTEIFSHDVVRFGPVHLSDSLLTSCAITVAVAIVAWLAGHRARLWPGRWQTLIEAAIGAAENATREVLPRHAELVLPFIVALWLFILLANLAGLIPGLHSPTRDLSVTAALAAIVFFSVHWFGIRAIGFRAYMRHYLTPNPLLLPFHVISEISRTIALAVRLFGNMLSLELVALLVLLIAGFLVPIPILMLHIVEALVQAYIFGMLALVYIAGAIQSNEDQNQLPHDEG